MGKVSVGLEVGTDSIKAVELVHRRRGYKLRKLARMKTPLANANSNMQEVIAEAIKGLFDKYKISTKQVISGVGGDSVIIRKIKTPLMTEKELKGAIRWEAEEYIPYPIDQVSLGFYILKEELLPREEKKMSVILVGVKKEVINTHLQILQRAGISPQVIDVNPLALFNIYELSNPGEMDGIALVEIGHSTTTIILLNKGNPFLIRSINIGGSQLTQAIVKELNIDYTAAEEMKRRYGLLSLSEGKVVDEKKIKVDQIIKKSIADLVEEIARSFEYYSSQTEGAKVKKIVLSGGTSSLKNMDNFLASELGLPVGIFNPFDNIVYNSRAFKPEYLAQEGPIFSIAVGLALRG